MSEDSLDHTERVRAMREKVLREKRENEKREEAGLEPVLAPYEKLAKGAPPPTRSGVDIDSLRERATGPG